MNLYYRTFSAASFGCGALLLCSTPLCAAPPAASPEQQRAAALRDASEQQRQQERERALQQQNTPRPEVHLSVPPLAVTAYPANEKPCFPLHSVRLEGEDAGRFQWALAAVNGIDGRCLGGRGIKLALDRVQNAILARGYVTTRVMAREQDLSHGVLTLTLQPGRIGVVRFSDPVGWRGRLWNALPARRGDLLNLRDIEQALENLRRVPNVAADIRIVPGQQEGSSDLLIGWQESRPLHLSLAVDDGGSKSTGRWLGSATLSVDAPFAQNDLFYASVGRDLFQHGPFGNRSHTLNYMIPYGYWLFSANYNDYTYHQNLPSAGDILTYSGKSENARFTVSRLLLRSQSHKTSLSLSAWGRQATNAVDGIDISQQRRRTAGWEAGINQHSYLNSATLDASLRWRRGTGAFGALPAPEESYHGGSARTGIASGDLNLNLPLTSAWRYNGTLSGQWSHHALTPQDRMAIAGRYTVRGFDGEELLSGERGVQWRNELAWRAPLPGHELYWAVDYGRVAGPGTRYLAGHQLAGSAVGLRGALWQRLSYDLFAGVPLVKPQGFHTSGLTSGFSVSLQL